MFPGDILALPVKCPNFKSLLRSQYLLNSVSKIIEITKLDRIYIISQTGRCLSV